MIAGGEPSESHIKMPNQYSHAEQAAPLSNSLLKTNISGTQGVPLGVTGMSDELHPTAQMQAPGLAQDSPGYQQMQNVFAQQVDQKKSPRPQHVDDADSTDASKADVFSPAGKTKRFETRQSLKDKALYDWSEVAYLFDDGLIPQELL